MTRIIHIMADGSQRDSVLGYRVPVNKKTEMVYRIIANRGGENEKKKNN